MIKKNIPLARPSFHENDILELVNVLKSGDLVQGQKVINTEQKLRSYLKSEYCSMVANGTASLHLALITLNVGIGDEVIIPAFSYIATANVVELVGAKPIFVDINIETFNIDENKIEEKITERTKVIIPVHEFGLCSNMVVINQIAKKHNIFVIEDAACALGAKINDRFAGTFGDFGSFSFHPRKAITSGEGGCLITNIKGFDNKIKTLRNHGIEYGNVKMDFTEAGFNYRITDFQSALLIGQIDRLDEIIKKRNLYANLYLEKIKNKLIKLPFQPKDYRHTWQTFHILMPDANKRKKLIEYLKDNGVQSNYGAQCIPFMTYYKNKYNQNSEVEFPNAFEAYTCGLAIPLFEGLDIGDIEYICTLINNFN